MAVLKIKWLGCEVCPPENQPKYIEVETNHGDEGYLYSGDICTCPRCLATGIIETDDGVAYPIWGE